MSIHTDALEETRKRKKKPLGNGTVVSKDKDKAGSVLSSHYNLPPAVGDPDLELEEEQAR